MISAKLFNLTDTYEDFSNIARISFARGANEYSEEENKRLITYLVKNNHWTPFGHNRIVLDVELDLKELSTIAILPLELRASLVLSCNLQGFRISNSVWGWKCLMESVYWPAFNSAKYGVVEEILSDLGLKVKEQSDSKFRTFCSVPSAVKEFDPNHTAIALSCTAPIYIARQLGKHQVGFCWNEESRRYISSDPEFYKVEQFRKKPERSIKQGSGDNFSEEENAIYKVTQTSCQCASLELYKEWLAEGMAPELARGELPQSMLVNWVWTSTLTGWVRLLKQRLDSHAQLETRRFAEQVRDVLQSQGWL